MSIKLIININITAGKMMCNTSSTMWNNSVQFVEVIALRFHCVHCFISTCCVGQLCDSHSFWIQVTEIARGATQSHQTRVPNNLYFEALGIKTSGVLTHCFSFLPPTCLFSVLEMKSETSSCMSRRSLHTQRVSVSWELDSWKYAWLKQILPEWRKFSFKYTWYNLCTVSTSLWYQPTIAVSGMLFFLPLFFKCWAAAVSSTIEINEKGDNGQRLLQLTERDGKSEWVMSSDINCCFLWLNSETRRKNEDI